MISIIVVNRGWLPWVRFRRTVPPRTRKDTSRQRMKVLAPCVQMIDKQWDVHSQSLPLCGPTRYWYWIQIIIWAVKKRIISQCKCNEMRHCTPQHCFPEDGVWSTHIPSRNKAKSITVYLDDLHDISNRANQIHAAWHQWEAFMWGGGGASRSWRANVPQRSDTSSSKNIL